MYNLLMCIPLLSIIVLLLIKKVNYKEIVNGLFCGLLSIIIISILDLIINLVTGAGNVYGVNNNITLATIVTSFLVGALPEEIGKFIGIKLTKPKDKTRIFMNAMLVAGTFAFIEGFLFSSSGSQHSIISRLLLPGHYFFEIVMSLIMIKGLEKNKSKLYNVFGLLAAMLSHQIFNTLNSIDFILYIFYVVGIATYAFIIYYILKMDVKPNDKKYKLTWLKLIVVLIVTLFIVTNFNAKFYELNEVVELDDNVMLNVTNYECHENTGEFKFYDYTCVVTVEMENKTTSDYSLSTFNFNLVNTKDTQFASSFEFEDDREDWLVKADEKVTIKIDYDFNTDEPKYDSFQAISKSKETYNYNLK